MHDEGTLIETALALQNQFEIDELKTEIEKDETYEHLKRLLADRIKELIDYEFDRFLNILYRIDVDENKVKAILAEKPFDEAIVLIAELIIQRQMQKVVTRRQYSKHGGDLSFDIE